MLTRFVSLLALCKHQRPVAVDFQDHEDLVDVDAPRPSHAYALHSSESRYCLRDVTILLNFHLATGVVVFFLFLCIHKIGLWQHTYSSLTTNPTWAMQLKSNPSTAFSLQHLSLIISLITLCFGIYEHRREHQFRCDILHAKLQLNNYTRSDSSIRVTVIDTTGKVLFDNQKDSPALMGNHLHRKEVQDALRTSTGLGLAIVKNIALQYGGSATASETPGGGLTITIELEIIP